MANSYHMEALRKQRLLDRKNEALRRLENQGSDLTKAVMDSYPSKKTPKESVLITDGGQFDQQRYQLPMFRVNEEGLKNRYRNHQELAPHCDEAFVLLYPGNDNSDYTCNVNQNNRRMNTMNQGGIGNNYHKHINFSNVASDKIYPILHPKPVFNVPVSELPCRKQHFKV